MRAEYDLFPLVLRERRVGGEEVAEVLRKRAPAEEIRLDVVEDGLGGARGLDGDGMVEALFEGRRLPLADVRGDRAAQRFEFALFEVRLLPDRAREIGRELFLLHAEALVIVDDELRQKRVLVERAPVRLEELKALGVLFEDVRRPLRHIDL